MNRARLGSVAILASSLVPLTADAADVRVRAEPSFAHPVGAPQTDHFGPGGGGMLKGGLTVLPFLDLQAHGGYYGFAGTKTDMVTIGALGGGARIQRPRSSGGLSPWVDGGVSYVRTGELDRAGLDAGGGVAFAINEDNSVWAGPFLRYMQVVQGDKVNMDGGDARILMLGFSLEFGAGSAQVTTPLDGRKEAPPPPPPPMDTDGDGVLDTDDRCPRLVGPRDNGGCPELDTDLDGLLDKDDKCPNEAGPKSNGGCPIRDADNDGVPDAEDACPGVPGDADNRGCPRYKQVVVKFDEKLEIGQKVYFAFDKATILPKSFDLLDEVAQALKDAPGIKVRIEGHTDSTGHASHNEELSQARALAVRDYLIDKSVEPNRLDARGYGSAQPLDTNATTAGREKNRRVEFVILKPKK